MIFQGIKNCLLSIKINGKLPGLLEVVYGNWFHSDGGFSRRCRIRVPVLFSFGKEYRLESDSNFDLNLFKADPGIRVGFFVSFPLSCPVIKVSVFGNPLDAPCQELGSILQQMGIAGKCIKKGIIPLMWTRLSCHGQMGNIGLTVINFFKVPKYDKIRVSVVHCGGLFIHWLGHSQLIIQVNSQSISSVKWKN